MIQRMTRSFTTNLRNADSTLSCFHFPVSVTSSDAGAALTSQTSQTLSTLGYIPNILDGDCPYDDNHEDQNRVIWNVAEEAYWTLTVSASLMIHGAPIGSTTERVGALHSGDGH